MELPRLIKELYRSVLIKTKEYKMSVSSDQRKLAVIQRAQKAFSDAKRAGRLDAKCCCERCPSEETHHLWVRSVNDAEMRKGKCKRLPGYFDVAVVPLCVPKRLVIRIWTEDMGAGINAKLKRLFVEGINACGRKGLMCVHSSNRHKQPKGVESNDPHGLFDFYRSEFSDWSALTDAQLAIVIEDYKAIEAVISRAGLW